MKKRVTVFCMIIVCLIINLFDVKMVNAQEDTISLTLEAFDREVKLNTEFKVALKVNSSKSMDNFETELVFDDSQLEYVKGDNTTIASKGRVLVKEKIEEKVDRTVYITFKTKSAGNIRIVTSGVKEGILKGSGIENAKIQNSSVELSCINEIKGKENLFDLKELQLILSDGKKLNLSSGLQPKKYTYSAVVDNNVESVSFKVKTANKNAKVKMDDSYNLSEGKISKLKFTLRADKENMECEYSVNVYRKSLEDMGDDYKNNLENADDIDDEFEKIFKVDEKNGDIIIKGTSYYLILDLEDKSILPKDFEEKTVTIEGKEVKAYSCKKTDDEFVLLYAKNLSTQDEGLYLYDTAEHTLQRFNESLEMGLDKDGKYWFDVLGENNLVMLSFIFLLLVLNIGLGVYVRSLVAKLKGINKDIKQAYEEAKKTEVETMLEEKKEMEEKRLALAKRNKHFMLKEVMKLNLEAEQSEIEDLIAKQVLEHHTDNEKKKKEKKKAINKIEDVKEAKEETKEIKEVKEETIDEAKEAKSEAKEQIKEAKKEEKAEEIKEAKEETIGQAKEAKSEAQEQAKKEEKIKEAEEVKEETIGQAKEAKSEVQEQAKKEEKAEEIKEAKEKTKKKKEAKKDVKKEIKKDNVNSSKDVEINENLKQA